MLRHINQRNQVTIPPEVLEATGVHPGDYLEVTSKDGIIVLIPKNIEDKSLTNKEWDKLEEKVKRQREKKGYTSYTDIKEAKKHSKRLTKK